MHAAIFTWWRGRTRVIMLNEAYAKPFHRAFALSLLGDLYRQGFRYLAMEMLDNYSNHTLTRESLHTGDIMRRNRWRGN